MSTWLRFRTSALYLQVLIFIGLKYSFVPEVVFYVLVHVTVHWIQAQLYDAIPDEYADPMSEMKTMLAAILLFTLTHLLINQFGFQSVSKHVTTISNERLLNNFD